MSNKRVVVTGMGIVSCLGSDIDQFYEKLLRGESGVSPITSFSCEDLPTRFAGIIKDFDPGVYVDKRQARRIDPFIGYTLVAGKKAIEMACLQLPQSNPSRCGIIIGSGMGGMHVFSDGVKTLLEKGARKVTPFFVPFIITNMGGALLAIDLGFMGPNYSVSTACATSNYAIIQAAEHIRRNEADVMVCGGVEAAVNPVGMAGFCSIKALSERNESPEKASRPWDKNRDGFVMGEGAGVIVLESLESALERKAPIIAEYLGGGLSCDAWHMTEPRADGAGVALCIQNALQDAKVTEFQVNYINAHATSTPVGDMAEVNALLKVFKAPSDIVINATKSMIGHSLGASGGIEAIATLQAIKTNKVHPTINLDDPEPLPFYVPKQAIDWNIDVAMSNSFGFGGHNASIIFGRYQG